MTTVATQVAKSTPFDPLECTPNFVSENVQDAICEARGSGVGTVVGYEFMNNGNTADKWLGFANATSSSDIIPFLAPQDVDLKGIQFANADDDVDCNLLIYKNGSLVHTEQIRNKRWYMRVGIPAGPSFLQGDRISVFLERHNGGTGDSTAQDPYVRLLLKFTSEKPATLGAQNGVT